MVAMPGVAETRPLTVKELVSAFPSGNVALKLQYLHISFDYFWLFFKGNLLNIIPWPLLVAGGRILHRIACSEYEQRTAVFTLYSTFNDKSSKIYIYFLLLFVMLVMCGLLDYTNIILTSGVIFIIFFLDLEWIFILLWFSFLFLFSEDENGGEKKRKKSSLENPMILQL